VPVIDHYADVWTQIRQFRLIHGGTVRSFDDVAAYYGLDICPHVGYNGCLVATKAEHDRGTVIPRERVIHWTPRRMTRLGLRKFLKVVARTRVLRYYLMNKATRIYAENSWATRAARELHIRLPRAASAADRRRVRWLISQGQKVSTPARRWAERPQEIHP
jgi:hypothetical protein